VRGLSWLTGTRWGRVSLAGAFLVAAGCGPGGCSPGPPPPTPVPRVKTFNCGASGAIGVQADVTTMTLDVVGAQGGTGGAGPGGPGGEVRTVINVIPGELLQINVGCAGGNGSGTAGGLFGAGDGVGGSGGTATVSGSGGGGGGGGSDVFSFTPSVLFAMGGGGGGGGSDLTATGGNGGAGASPATAGQPALCGTGGGFPGVDVSPGGAANTKIGCDTAGFAGGPGGLFTDGGDGAGGALTGGGGGGGGLGGGGGGSANTSSAGGGGGSGFCLSGCVSQNAGVNSGNGRVTVSFNSIYSGFSISSSSQHTPWVRHKRSSP
jgi:hypothetical protein